MVGYFGSGDPREYGLEHRVQVRRDLGMLTGDLGLQLED